MSEVVTVQLLDGSAMNVRRGRAIEEVNHLLTAYWERGVWSAIFARGDNEALARWADDGGPQP